LKGEDLCKGALGIIKTALNDTRRLTVPIVSVVGYTNAGKSALVNRLTKSQLLSENQVFASLDPHMRRVRLPSGLPAIFVDTVGFISELPDMLLTAFRSTLEEVANSDLILHVRDVDNVSCITRYTDSTKA
jgi:GTP-binding protein HflX